MPKKEMITTEADRLLSFVQEKGEISLDDTAKELGIPVKTVESYANFFEEEGLIGLKYKFTTPYLVVKNSDSDVPEIEFSLSNQKEEKKKYETILSELSEQLDLLRIKVKAGEYYMLKEEFPKLLKKFRDLLKSKQTPLKQKDTKQFQAKIEDMALKLKSANTKLELKKQEAAREDFVFVEKNLRQVFDSITKSEIQGSNKLRLEKDNIKELSSKINQYIKEGKFNEANDLLALIQDKYETMPQEYTKRESSLQAEIDNLKKDISKKKTKATEKEMEAKTAKIHHILRSAKRGFEKGDIIQAIKYFNSVKEIYLDLPKGFVNQKIKLSSNILAVFKQLNLAKHKALEARFSELSKRFKAQLVQLKQELSAHNFNNAIANYNKAVAIFKELPRINAPLRNNFKSYLLLIYERLSKSKRAHVDENLKQLIRDTKKGINKTLEYINKREFSKAKTEYTNVLRRYKEIPRSHTEVLLPIQEGLLQLYMKFAHELDLQSQEELEQGLLNISQTLDRVDAFVEAEKFEDSLKHFQKVMILYNMLPKGFIKQKLAIKERLVKTDKRVTTNVDELVLKGLPHDVKVNYHALLKHIAFFYMHIESNAFNLASIDYRHIKHTIDRLPFGVIKGSVLISRELKEITHEVKLINQVKELKLVLESGNVRKAKTLYSAVLIELKKLDRHEPQVIGLYRYIKHIIEEAKTRKDHYSRSLKPIKLKSNEPVKRTVTKEELLNEFKESISKLSPAVKEEVNETDQLKTIAEREHSNKLDKEFSILDKTLEGDVLNTLANPNKQLLISNKLKMAKMFTEFGEPERARNLVQEVISLDPKNEKAKKEFPEYAK